MPNMINAVDIRTSPSEMVRRPDYLTSSHEKAQQRRKRPSWQAHAAALLIILPLSIFACFYNLGANSFGDGDQTIHAQVVQEMHRDGHYWTPTRFGFYYFNKPPFKMWLSAGFVRTFGESTFNYRALDAAFGIGIILLTYFFAAALFSSTIIGLVSALTLLGTQGLFVMHGVRESVQDSLMILADTAAIWVGWNMLEQIRSVDQAAACERPTLRTGLFKRAALGGILIGIALLTKSAAGLIPLIVIGATAACGGSLGALWRNGKLAAFITAMLAALIPAVYVIPHLFSHPWASDAIFISEVYKRAAVGYVHVSNHLYYLHRIIDDRHAAPAELLALSAIFALYQAIKFLDRRYILLICWGVLLVLLFSCLRSKLPWYISPALPGMAIMIGSCVGAGANALRSCIVSGIRDDRWQPLSIAGLGLFTALAFTSIGWHIFRVDRPIFLKTKTTETEQLVKFLQRRQRKTNELPVVLRYRTPTLSWDEHFYLRMVDAKDIPDESATRFAEANDALHPSFVLTAPEQLKEVAAVRKIYGYKVLTWRHQRLRALEILALTDQMPELFNPADLSVDMSQDDPRLMNGWSTPQSFFGIPVRTSVGRHSLVLIDGTLPLQQLGITLNAELASVVPSAQGVLAIRVFLNDVQVAEFKEVPEGFHSYRAYIPGHIINNGVNVLALQYSPPRGKEPAEQERLVLYKSLTLSLPSGDAARDNTLSE